MSSSGAGDQGSLEIDPPDLTPRVVRQRRSVSPRRAADVENAAREVARLGAMKLEHAPRLAVEVSKGIELVIERRRRREHAPQVSFGTISSRRPRSSASLPSKARVRLTAFARSLGR